jgi:hypothetical protein
MQQQRDAYTNRKPNNRLHRARRRRTPPTPALSKRRAITA